MTYNEFTETLLDKLDDRIEKGDNDIVSYRLFEDGDTSEDPQDIEFIRSTNIKYNKTESDVLKGDFLQILFLDGDNMARFEMKYLYKSFEQGGWDEVWKIIDDNIGYAKNMDMSDMVNSIHEYDKIKDRLILRPLNYTDNRYALKDFIYRQVGDIALVLYGVVPSDPKFGLNTFKIPKPVFEVWGKDFDEVMDNALVNANIRSVPRMYNETTLNIGMPWNPDYNVGAYMALGANMKISRMSIFTTYPNTNGAISYFYPGVKERIAQMAGGDYYVAFTGIDEFHVHSVKEMGARDVLLNLKNMNKNVNKPDELLSRKVYRYKADTGELVVLEL